MFRSGLVLMAGGLLLAIVSPADAQQPPPPLLRETLAIDPSLDVTMKVVELPPAGNAAPTTKGQPSHSHPGSTYVYVLSGAVRSRLGDGAEALYKAGQAWSENPGESHWIVNAGAAETARLLVLFVTKKPAP